MLQPSLFPPQSLSVSEINRYLRELFESDEILSDVWVQGEVSNLARPASGHVYLTLKDSLSALKCVIWKQTTMRLPITLQNGMAVELHGSVGVYERDGQYQLYVDAVRLTGEGALYQEFLRLKARLQAEGLFDEERKRPLPELPKKIGIVTSSTGAALQDILNTLRRRYPLAEVVLAPCAVQGAEAIPQIIASITALNAEPGIDVLLLARGGGSLEDLWAFNDENVVRAVAGSRVPVITGIGHETDFTLSDFASDTRAPTPTGAAEIAVPNVTDLRDQVSGLATRLEYTLQRVVGLERGNLLDLRSRLEKLSPAWQLRSDRQRMDELAGRLDSVIAHSQQFKHAELLNLGKRLISLNPYAVLQRGYAIVTDAQGGVVRSVNQVRREDVLDIRVSDGDILSRVLSDPCDGDSGGTNNGKD
ncbi:MAG TPA: exodeoxyribonuclease VII large subunit [Anaerolineaceae bacterium]|nr:exodeoxyribonuclease VII large subunit [Anaerolineaceae bacterium]